MNRFRTAAVVLAAAAAVFVLPAAAKKPDDAPAPKAAVPAPMPVRAALVKGLLDALKAEEDWFIRLLLARALVKAAPDDETGPGVLVKELLTGDHPADAYTTIEELMPLAPAGLIRALLPVLKDRKDVNRQRAASLLGKIDPKNLP
jgi:hypothetical protein